MGTTATLLKFRFALKRNIRISHSSAWGDGKRMSGKFCDYKDFLASQEHSELADIRQYVHSLLENIEEHASSCATKRPHMAMPERRAPEERYQIGLPATCWDALQPFSKAVRTTVRALDISRSGFRFISPEPYRPMQILRLQLNSPGHQGPPILIQTVRVRRCQLPDQETYDIGCQTISESMVQQAENEITILDGFCDRLRDPSQFGILHIASTRKAEEIGRLIRQQGYALTQVASSRNIQGALRAWDQSAPPTLVICPASHLLRKPEPAWLGQVARAYPQIGLLAIADSETELAATKMSQPVDEGLTAQAVDTALIGAIHQTLFGRLVETSTDLPPLHMKILVASPDEMRARRFQTLLHPEACCTEKCDSYTAARTELDGQFFHAVILDHRLLEQNSPEILRELRTLYPWLAIVAETQTLQDAARLTALGADCVLPASCKRNDLTICIQRVQRLFRQKTSFHK
ncbi:MAG TPA: hypothetical protein PLA90_01640 [Candidatus Sumerlaeota bacterium]|nr:hypothetical protein [Candidatus Sumerlaeota bacterium]